MRITHFAIRKQIHGLGEILDPIIDIGERQIGKCEAVVADLLLYHDKRRMKRVFGDDERQFQYSRWEILGLLILRLAGIRVPVQHFEICVR